MLYYYLLSISPCYTFDASSYISCCCRRLSSVCCCSSSRGCHSMCWTLYVTHWRMLLRRIPTTMASCGGTSNLLLSSWPWATVWWILSFMLSTSARSGRDWIKWDGHVIKYGETNQWGTLIELPFYWASQNDDTLHPLKNAAFCPETSYFIKNVPVWHTMVFKVWAFYFFDQKLADVSHLGQNLKFNPNSNYSWWTVVSVPR